MNRMMSAFRGAIVALLVVSCAHPDRQPAGELTTAAAPETINITVLHTNDVHGHAWPVKRKDGVVRGGFAAQAALIQKIREEAAKKQEIVLVLSAGDINTGTPESDLIDAEPDIRAMNYIKYDAMVLGNHEFDGGLNKLKKQLGWKKFPVLSANVGIPGTEFKKVDPFVILDRERIKIGILGLTTDTLKKVILASVGEKLDVQNPIEVAKNQVEQMKVAGAELIIALTHVGISTTTGSHARIIENDELRLAKEVPDIKLVVGGHSHTLLKEGIKVGDSLVVQAGEKGEFLGRVDLTWDPEKKTVTSAKAQVLPILPTEGEDPKVKKLLTQSEKKVSKILEEQLGTTQNEMDGERDSVRHQETNLGNFICDVMRKFAKTDIALFNGGGIRASIPRGPIRLRDLLKAFPFRNTLVTGTLTGKQLKEALQTGLKHQNASGSFLHVSGLRYRAKDGILQAVTVNGAHVSDANRYRVASNNFLFGGGDYLDVLTQAENITDTGTPVDELMAKYIRAHPVVYAKKENRIILD